MSSTHSKLNRHLDNSRKLRSEGTLKAENVGFSLISVVTVVGGALIAFLSLVESEALGTILAILGSFSGVAKVALVTAGTAIVAVLAVRYLAVDLKSRNQHDH